MPPIIVGNVNKRIWIPLVVLLGAVVGLLIFPRPDSPRASYHGKSLRAWLLQLVRNSSPPHQDPVAVLEAERAINQIGTNAFPILLAWAAMRDPPFNVTMKALLGDSLALKLNVWSAEDYHAFAGWGFHLLNASAKPVVPELILLLKDPDPSIRAGAVYCLAKIGPNAEEAISPLIQSLVDPDVHNDSLSALRLIGVAPDVMVSNLMGFLSLNNSGQKGWAILRLGAFGTNAQVAIPSLERLLPDPNPYISGAASNALEKIDAGR